MVCRIRVCCCSGRITGTRGVRRYFREGRGLGGCFWWIPVVSSELVRTVVSAMHRHCFRKALLYFCAGTLWTCEKEAFVFVVEPKHLPRGGASGSPTSLKLTGSPQDPVETLGFPSPAPHSPWILCLPWPQVTALSLLSPTPPVTTPHACIPGIQSSSLLAQLLCSNCFVVC